MTTNQPDVNIRKKENDIFCFCFSISDWIIQLPIWWFYFISIKKSNEMKWNRINFPEKNKWKISEKFPMNSFYIFVGLCRRCCVVVDQWSKHIHFDFWLVIIIIIPLLYNKKKRWINQHQQRKQQMKKIIVNFKVYRSFHVQCSVCVLVK